MSTRSLIGMLKEDGTCQTIYCHWDGYPEYNGKMLLENYMEAEKIEALLTLGDISLLNEDVAPTTDTHAFDSPEPGIVIAYHRDRGEALSEICIWPSKEKAAELAHQRFWAEYIYLFDKDKWIFCNTTGRGKWKFRDLASHKFES